MPRRADLRPVGSWGASLRHGGWHAGKWRRRLHTVVVPEILSLSGHVSGLRGGQTVAIDGTGFDTTCTNNKVTLAGRPCAVATCSPTRVTCVVGENTQNLDDVTRKGTKGMQWLAVKDVHGQSHNAERLVVSIGFQTIVIKIIKVLRLITC